jgi:hypothetical protein
VLEGQTNSHECETYRLTGVLDIQTLKDRDRQTHKSAKQTGRLTRVLDRLTRVLDRQTDAHEF